MAHLKQKQISDNSCKAIIIDTLLEAVRPLTQEELSREITSLFHILVSAERLKQQIHALSLEGAILLDEDDYLRISPSKQPDSAQRNYSQERSYHYMARQSPHPAGTFFRIRKSSFPGATYFFAKFICKTWCSKL